jgi:hypothetical protein
MVSNSDNINKTNTISSQFTSLNKYKYATYNVKQLGFSVGQANTCGVVKPFNGNPLDNWISEGNTYIKKTMKIMHRFAFTKNTPYNHKMHEINMDITIAESMTIGS